MLSLIQCLPFSSYRDFRESAGPLYSQTTIYWNVTAARLAFIIVFEHVIFFIIYLMEWLVPDVPREIRNKIDHERYIDQRERWASKTTEDHLKSVVISSEALARIMRGANSNGLREGSEANETTTTRFRHRDEASIVSMSGDGLQ